MTTKINPDQEVFDKLIEKLMNGGQSKTSPSFTGKITQPSKEKQPDSYPLTNICRSEQDVILFIEVAVPGFSKEDIEVYIQENILYIKGTVPSEVLADEVGMKYNQKNIEIRSFVRKIRLMPEFAKSETLQASVDCGILTVSISPVDLQQAKSIKIPVY